MAEEKKAKKVFTLEEIRFNEENKTNAILACIPLVGLIIYFTEKDDNFVKYMAAQFALLWVLSFVIGFVPIINLIAVIFFFIVNPILMIIGMVKVSKGERFDIPVVSGWALKLMGSI
jgi:uncharacterized membrane protein